MTTAVIVMRGEFAFQESAPDTPEGIRAGVMRIKALHPSAFRDDANGLRAVFVTLDANQKILHSKRIDLAEDLPGAAPAVEPPAPAPVEG